MCKFRRIIGFDPSQQGGQGSKLCIDITSALFFTTAFAFRPGQRCDWSGNSTAWIVLPFVVVFVPVVTAASFPAAVVGMMIPQHIP